jgi:hypothetical protein
VYPARQVQDVTSVLFAAENVLLGHAVQFAAAVDEKVFISQDMQATEPVAFLYVPAPQGLHAVPSAPVYPARQVQDASRGLLAFEKVLFGHAVQLVAVTAVE